MPALRKDVRQVRLSDQVSCRLRCASSRSFKGRHNVDNCRKRQEKYRRQRQLPGPQINLPTPTFSAPGSEDEVGSLVKRKPDGAWHEERGHYEGQFAHTQ